jgi:hypothetical protein
VVVKRLKSNSMEIYVKGAPEVMVDICEKDSCAFLLLFKLFCITQQTHGQFHKTTMTYFHTIRNVASVLLPWLARVSRDYRGSKHRR